MGREGNLQLFSSSMSPTTTNPNHKIGYITKIGSLLLLTTVSSILSIPNYYLTYILEKKYSPIFLPPLTFISEKVKKINFNMLSLWIRILAFYQFWWVANKRYEKHLKIETFITKVHDYTGGWILTYFFFNLICDDMIRERSDFSLSQNVSNFLSKLFS